MNKYIFYDLVDTDKGRVTTIHNRPELLSGALPDGFPVGFIPEPESNGKVATLYCTPSTKTLFYTYSEALPASIEEQQAKRIASLETMVASLLGV